MCGVVTVVGSDSVHAVSLILLLWMEPHLLLNSEMCTSMGRG